MFLSLVLCRFTQPFARCSKDDPELCFVDEDLESNPAEDCRGVLLDLAFSLPDPAPALGRMYDGISAGVAVFWLPLPFEEAVVSLGGQPTEHLFLSFSLRLLASTEARLSLDEVSTTVGSRA